MYVMRNGEKDQYPYYLYSRSGPMGQQSLTSLPSDGDRQDTPRRIGFYQLLLVLGPACLRSPAPPISSASAIASAVEVQRGTLGTRFPGTWISFVFQS